MKSKREREEPCGVCGHYHDVSGSTGASSRGRGRAPSRQPPPLCAPPPPQYEGGEPCGICGHRLVQTEQPKPQAPSALPTEVLPGFLFLGTYDHASRAELLKTLGIGNILNVRGRAAGRATPRQGGPASRVQGAVRAPSC